jgi:hypothetical protein
MVIPTVTPLGGEPTAHPQHAHCGHTRHVGTCPSCQRAAQRRSEAQLAAAVTARETWAPRALPRPALAIAREDAPLVCQRARTGL